jgi:DNA mismatch repair ATPase MutS
MKATKARHPLQELLVDAYITNDVVMESNPPNGLIQIVTGQNGSGTLSFRFR